MGAIFLLVTATGSRVCIGHRRKIIKQPVHPFELRTQTKSTSVVCKGFQKYESSRNQKFQDTHSGSEEIHDARQYLTLSRGSAPLTHLVARLEKEENIYHHRHYRTQSQDYLAHLLYGQLLWRGVAAKVSEESRQAANLNLIRVPENPRQNGTIY